MAFTTGKRFSWRTQVWKKVKMNVRRIALSESSIAWIYLLLVSIETLTIFINSEKWYWFAFVTKFQIIIDIFLLFLLYTVPRQFHVVGERLTIHMLWQRLELHNFYFVIISLLFCNKTQLKNLIDYVVFHSLTVNLTLWLSCFNILIQLLQQFDSVASTLWLNCYNTLTQLLQHYDSVASTLWFSCFNTLTNFFQLFESVALLIFIYLHSQMLFSAALQYSSNIFCQVFSLLFIPFTYVTSHYCRLPLSGE